MLALLMEKQTKKPSNEQTRHLKQISAHNLNTFFAGCTAKLSYTITKYMNISFKRGIALKAKVMNRFEKLLITHTSVSSNSPKS